jgi:hypothetical protein
VTQANTKWDLPTLSNGVHNLSITETNASGTSVPLFLQMTVDAPAATPSVISLMATAVDATPATPAIMGLIDHSVSNYADFSYGSTLHDDAPGIVFTTIPGATYSMYDNGALIGTMVATKTNTNWTVPSVLFNGAHELTLMATDAAGNNSAQASINFTVAAGPAAPAYLGLIDHSVSNYAEADIAQVTHDAHPSLVLSATVGDTLNLFDNGQLVGTMVVTQANTKWDLPTLSNGVHNLSITETNASGTSVPLFLQMTVDATPAPAVQSLVSAAHAVSQDVTAVSNDASVGLHDKFVASAGHQNVDLNVDPNSYFKQSSAHIEGGSKGVHTMHLEGSHQVLDLTSLTGQTAAAKISGVQAFDLGGHGNTLHLSLVDVLNLGQADLFQHDGNKQLMVNGSSADTIDLSHAKLAGVADAPWVEHGTASVGGVTYNVYQNSAAHADLLIQQGVHAVVH